MKLIKAVAFVIVIVLVLNYFGMLNSETSRKVDNAVELAKVKINDFKYKDKPITDMSLKELSSNISSDITYLKEDIITTDGIKLSGNGLTTTINPTKDKILTAQVDTSETKAVESIEKLLLSFTKREIKIPEEILDKGNITITVEKTNGEYSVKFNEGLL